MSKYLVLAAALIVLAIKCSQAATHQVEIQNPMKFVPATITIKAGDTIVWTNKSNGVHNVVSLPIKMRSKMLKKGDKFEFTFKEKGIVDYICEPHRTHMKGKITVD